MLLLSFLNFAILPLLIIPFWVNKTIKNLLTACLVYSIFLFNYSLLFLTSFSNLHTLSYNAIFEYNFNPSTIYNIVFENILFNFEINFILDGISIWFVVLTTFLLPPAILYSYIYSQDPNLKLYLFLLFFLNFTLIIFFSTFNILIFYIFFEIVLIPVFLQILIWGSRSRKILAGFYFFLYTFVGSIFFLFAIFVLYSITGSYNFNILLYYSYSQDIQTILWPMVALALMIKVPMMPFHLWLPEAHVEAPTISSVYLASLLLKLGSYGFIRILIPIFPYGTLIYSPAIQLIALISIVYCSGIIIRQIDLKKIIAYSSIIHMNMAIFGLFSFNLIGLQGAVLLMIAHGLTSGALFLLIGLLYERFKTRLLVYYGGLFLIMPIYSFIFIFFSFANVGFPGTINFSAELLLILGIINYGFISKTLFSAILISIGLFSSVCYSIWLVNKLLFGNIKGHLWTYDLSEREILVLIPFILYVFLFGVSPFILNYFLLFNQKLLSLFIIVI